MIEGSWILITRKADGAERRQAWKKKRPGGGEEERGGEGPTVECVTSRDTKVVQERRFQNNVLAVHRPPFISYNATPKSGTRRCKQSRVVPYHNRWTGSGVY